LDRYKCNLCHIIIKEEHLVEGNCPECGKEVEKMCLNDHLCTCTEDIFSGLWFCKACGKPICPCGSHDVEQISRVTGYLAEVNGWNSGKLAELKDRQHYNVLTGAIE
jgi:hypothetical protein